MQKKNKTKAPVKVITTITVPKYTQQQKDAHHAKLYKALMAAPKPPPRLTKYVNGPGNHPHTDYGKPAMIHPYGGKTLAARSNGKGGRRAPGFPTSMSVRPGRSGGGRLSQSMLDASAGAAAAVTAVVAPWECYRNNISPGVPDGSCNETKRYWTSNVGTVNSLTSVTDLSEVIRLVFNPNLVQHVQERTTFTNKIPAGATETNATEYAAIAAEGILFYRVVALGVQVKNITDEAQLEGATTLTQVTNALVQSTTSQADLDGYTPNYIGASNKPGVIMQAFWLPEADNNAYTSIAAGIPAASARSMGQLSFSTTTSPGVSQIWFYQTFMLIETLGTGSGLQIVNPYIGDPTTFAEGLGNQLSYCPQFCLKRNFKSDDVVETAVGSGIEMLEDAVPGAGFVKKAIEDVFGIDIVKETSKWARGGIKKIGDRIGSWFSGLWGQTGITPTEFKLAGLFVSMKEAELDNLQELSALYSGPGELRAWADQVLGTDITYAHGRFIDSPYMRGEIPHPGPMPKLITRLEKARIAAEEKKESLPDIFDGTEADNIANETTLSRRAEPASPALSFVSVRSNRMQPLQKK